MKNQGRGLRSPCTPRQGYHPCTRSATHNWIEQGCFRMMGEETKNSTTGTMKTIKIAVGKINFPTAYFFVFPGCYTSGWRHSAAGPCVPVALSIRKVTIIFCQGISACFVEGRCQSLRPYGPAFFTVRVMKRMELSFTLHQRNTETASPAKACRFLYCCDRMKAINLNLEG